MKRRTALMIVLTTAIWLGFVLPAVAQQKSLKEQLVGTWTFVSSNAKLPDGSPLWGNNPKSLLSSSQWLTTRGTSFALIVQNSRRITACRRRQTKTRPRCREALPLWYVLGQRGGQDRHVSR